ncbi:MAG: type VI secretion system-associated protein TagF, partial [Nitrococcus sp.]|nr:type VI secretion system-associated protein TagF [Nitrococcus sp.]
GVQLGFYGKLPSHGDFVRRRIGHQFLSRWDRWLQEMVTATRQVLGEQWLQTYLTSPVWRFSLSPGICGDQGHAGILMPSVDSVGRYFPLTLATTLPDGVSALNLAVEESPWFARLEQLALSVLHQKEGFNLDEFDLRVEALGWDLRPRINLAGLPGLAASSECPQCHDIGDLEELPFSMLALLDACFAARNSGGYSLWWTDGSEHVAPCWWVCPGLPEPALFTAALDGEWSRHGWHSERIRWSAAAKPAEAATTLAPLAFRSGSKTHPGHVRTVNEDSCLEMGERGVWAVADGVGGFAAGAAASGMVVNALSAIDGGGDLQDRVNQVCETLSRVNRHLVHMAERPVDARQSASTVAVLVAGGTGCCYVWGGDSRIYRLRDRRLSQCTRDHSVVQDMVDAGEIPAQRARDHPHGNVITRAVGAGAELQIDVEYADLLPGDRFLLCSDGVHGGVTDAELEQILVDGDCDDACRRILDLVLSREARDNATAVVVDVIEALQGR